MLKSQDVRRFQERLKRERDAIESRIATNKHGIQETVQFRGRVRLPNYEILAAQIS